eukprot:4072659-Pleurochrysis_carterae.AAC.6
MIFAKFASHNEGLSHVDDATWHSRNDTVEGVAEAGADTAKLKHKTRMKQAVCFVHRSEIPVDTCCPSLPYKALEARWTFVCCINVNAAADTTSVFPHTPEHISALRFCNKCPFKLQHLLTALAVCKWKDNLKLCAKCKKSNAVQLQALNLKPPSNLNDESDSFDTRSSCISDTEHLVPRDATTATER